MASLLDQLQARAIRETIPLNAQVDLTYRCNADCIHCYAAHHAITELTTARVCDVLDQLAGHGTLFLTFSGGEAFIRKDLFDIFQHARALRFCITLKTNGTLIGETEAARLYSAEVDRVQISIYSRRAEIHDGITRVPGSLERSLAAIRLLISHGVRVAIMHVVMRQNSGAYHGVIELARELGIPFHADATVTPPLSGGQSVPALNVTDAELSAILHDPVLNGRPNEDCPEPQPPVEGFLGDIPCKAGHSSCYIAPDGEVYPCVQFPISCGNIGQLPFGEIWLNSPILAAVRAVRLRDLHGCSGCPHLGSCARCPGLAYMSGDMLGISILDCKKAAAGKGVAAPSVM